MKFALLILLATFGLVFLLLLALGLIRRHRRDPFDPVFGEGRDDE